MLIINEILRKQMFDFPELLKICNFQVSIEISSLQNFVFYLNQPEY